MTAHSLIESVGPYGYAVARLACNGTLGPTAVLRLASHFEEEPDEGWIFLRLAEGCSHRYVEKELKMGPDMVRKIVHGSLTCVMSILDPSAIS